MCDSSGGGCDSEDIGGGCVSGTIQVLGLYTVVAIQRTGPWTAVEGCTTVESLSMLVAMVEGLGLGLGFGARELGFGWEVEKWVLEGIFR
ncbi:hypothetical protein Acr_00g0060800 [Actinidia rufa]|uniref:Uncharacterized protein n=1 Tax=Actinidia rufa TaxID=165716 RepID=A0A7J0DNI9_9ERIC|nr:hypothetical protein Acr_00g0060800 [Actinidia rufa]